MLPPPLPESLKQPLTLPKSLQQNDTGIPSKDVILHRPTVEELMVEVQQWYDYNTRTDASKESSSQAPKTIVIAGEGEPTLRLNDLMQFILQLRAFVAKRSVDNCGLGISNLRLRIMTNGLLTQTQTLEFLQCCSNTTSLSSTETSAATSLLPVVLPVTISVLFISSDPSQYNDIMQPCLPSIDDNTNNNDHSSMPVEKKHPSATTPHEMAQHFIRTVVDVISKQPVDNDTNNPPLLSIEVTAIDRPDVDKEALSRCVALLGVTTPIRWRPYFP
jgi:hypothetical protein